MNKSITLAVTIIYIIFAKPIIAQEIEEYKVGRTDYCHETSVSTEADRQFWQFREDGPSPTTIINLVENLSIDNTTVTLCQRVVASPAMVYSELPDNAILMEARNFQLDLGTSTCQTNLNAIVQNPDHTPEGITPLKGNTQILIRRPDDKLLIPLYEGLLPLPTIENRWIIPRALPDNHRGIGFTTYIPFDLVTSEIDRVSLEKGYLDLLIDNFETLYRQHMPPEWTIDAYPIVNSLNINLVNNGRILTLVFTADTTSRFLILNVRGDEVISVPTAISASLGRHNIEQELANKGWTILANNEKQLDNGNSILWILAQQSDQYLLLEFRKLGDDDFQNYRRQIFTACNIKQFLPNWIEG